MKKLIHLFVALTLLFMGVVVGLSPIIVSAKDERQNPVISIANPPTKDKKGIEVLCDDANARIHEKNIWASVKSSKSIFKGKSTDGYNLDDVEAKSFLIFSKDGDVIDIEVNMIEYRKLKEREKQIVMQQALSAVVDAQNVSRTNRNKIYNNICALDDSTSKLVRQLGEDVNADFSGAYDMFRPFSGTIGKFLGVISLAMFILLSLTIVVDLAYIVLPFVQLFIDSITNKHNKVRVVSIEARNAVKEAESKAGSGYVNPVGIYFSSKTKQLIAISICLVYLVSGQIYNLVGSIIDYFNLALNI